MRLCKVGLIFLLTIYCRGSLYAFDFRLGPKVGIFCPIDNTLSKYHGANFSWGANLETDLLKDAVTVRVEYENYHSIYKKDAYEEELIISPLCLAAIVKTTDIFYFGFGLGLADSTVKIKNIPGSLNGNFMSYELMIGYRKLPVDVAVKYSFSKTGPLWNNADLGGVSVFGTVYFGWDFAKQ